MRQDAIVLNFQRAWEQTIDLANHLIKEQKAGIPQTSKAALHYRPHQNGEDQVEKGSRSFPIKGYSNGNCSKGLFGLY